MLAFGVSGVAALVDIELSHHTIGQRDDQPSSVRYPESATTATYHLAVVHRTSWLWRRQLPDEICVSADPGMSYGHCVTLGTSYAGPGALTLKSVEWRVDGVSVRLTPGHELFIPANAYLGGR